MARNLIDKIVYKITQKPTCYKEVKHPPNSAIGKLLRPQVARQEQYNNWSKTHKVYSGSYLPNNGQKLEKQGWTNETPKSINQSNPNNPTTYKRKSTNQWVRNDKTHWHWYNWWKKENIPKNFMRGHKNDPVYLDKFGKPCARNSNESHIQGEKE